MGDTLTHLESLCQVEELIKLSSEKLQPDGKLVLSFRDYTNALQGEQRFIPVKSDDTRILTCFLEYFPSHVRVHDVLHEKKDSQWVMQTSSYMKLRLQPEMVSNIFTRYGMKTVSQETINRMVYLIAAKE